MAWTTLRLAGVGLFSLVIAQLLEKIEIRVFPEFVKAFGHELSIVSSIILVAGLVLHVIFEGLEKHIKPPVENAFESAKSVLEDGFKEITRVFSEGFEQIQEVLAYIPHFDWASFLALS